MGLKEKTREKQKKGKDDLKEKSMGVLCVLTRVSKEGNEENEDGVFWGVETKGTGLGGESNISRTKLEGETPELCGVGGGGGIPEKKTEECEGRNRERESACGGKTGHGPRLKQGTALEEGRKRGSRPKANAILDREGYVLAEDTSGHEREGGKSPPGKSGFLCLQRNT